MDEPGERPNKIIMGEIARQGSAELVPEDVKSVRQAIYRRRRKTQPKLPQGQERKHTRHYNSMTCFLARTRR